MLPIICELAKRTLAVLIVKTLTPWNVSDVRTSGSPAMSRVKRVVRFCIHVPKHDHTAWEKGRAPTSSTIACLVGVQCGSGCRERVGGRGSWLGLKAARRGGRYMCARAPRRACAGAARTALGPRPTFQNTFSAYTYQTFSNFETITLLFYLNNNHPTFHSTTHLLAYTR